MQIDVALPAVHGTNVEDGAFQGFLQTLGVPYASCDVLSSAVGMDKYVMKTVFADNGVPVLPCVVTDVKRYTRHTEETLAEIESKTRYPVIVKPINLGSSVGIRKAKNREELTEALEYAFTFSIRVLVENALEHIREINCAVLGDYESAEASECEEPLANDEILSYQDKYVGGGKGMASLKRKIPAEIPAERREEVRSLAVRAFRSLGCCGVARVDFMLDEDEEALSDRNQYYSGQSFVLSLGTARNEVFRAAGPHDFACVQARTGAGSTPLLI